MFPPVSLRTRPLLARWIENYLLVLVTCYGKPYCGYDLTGTAHPRTGSGEMAGVACTHPARSPVGRTQQGRCRAVVYCTPGWRGSGPV